MKVFKDIRNYIAIPGILFFLALILIPAPAVAQSDDRDVTVSNPTFNESDEPMDREDFEAWRERLHPTWAFELSGSSRALGGQNISDSQAGYPARALSIGVEYQPAFFQSLNVGVLSFGPSFSIFPLARNLTDSTTRLVGTSPFSLWSVGGEVRYQAYFSPHQFLIPTAAYSIQVLDYDFAGTTAAANGSGPVGPSGKVAIQGPSVGLWLLLNDLSEEAASQMYQNTGFLRSYFVTEFQVLSGSNPDVSISGPSFFFGLRLER